MAKDYISREAVLTVLDWDCASQDALNAIKAIPAADVVEVVRCGECKHLCVRSGALGVYQCAIHGDYPSGEYFCADGERKDGGQDDV